MIARVLLLFTLWHAPLHADLKRALAEPDLEKRSRLALENARSAYESVREAYGKGEMPKVTEGARELEESVELANASLRATGKNPRKNPKYFKSAEITTRDLLRRVENFQREMSFEDRPVMDAARNKLQQVHEELLVGLMEGRKK